MKAIDIRDWFRRMPWKRGNSPVTLAPEYESYLFEQWEHGVFDDYWKQLGIYGEGFYDQYVDAAMVHMSSWFDAYTRTATDNYSRAVETEARAGAPHHGAVDAW
jgi:predicted acyl esterase